MLRYTPTPIQEIFDEVLEKAGVRLHIKREDLNHPHVSGNKWWKLKYNLEAAAKQKKNMLLTFGGAYSNHIFATAAAANEFGLKSIGIIRGEKTLPLNSTLAFAENKGMTLHYVTREEYRKKNESEFIKNLHERFGDFYLLPEGGTNQFAIRGCEEFAREQLIVGFDFVFLPVGTGGTMAGIIAGLNGTEIIGFSVLKGDFLKNDVKNLLENYTNINFKNWSINTDYHFGGYAKSTPILQQFIRKFEEKHRILLDPIYTGKMLAGIFDMVEKKKIPRGANLLALHTGGLQDRNTSII